MLERRALANHPQHLAAALIREDLGHQATVASTAIREGRLEALSQDLLAVA